MHIFDLNIKNLRSNAYFLHWDAAWLTDDIDLLIGFVFCRFNLKLSYHITPKSTQEFELGGIWYDVLVLCFLTWHLTYLTFHHNHYDDNY